MKHLLHFISRFNLSDTINIYQLFSKVIRCCSEIHDMKNSERLDICSCPKFTIFLLPFVFPLNFKLTFYNKTITDYMILRKRENNLIKPGGKD